jgi:ketosteroid isomerase-like protein
MTEAIRLDAAARYVPPTSEQLAAARDIVGRFAERWADPRADDLRELMHPDTQNLIPPMKTPGNREDVVELFRQVLQQLSDLRIAVERWAPTENAVMVEWRASATVAGQPLSWTGVDRFCLQGDRMIEGRVYWDTRGFAERIAAIAGQAAGS